MVAFDLLWWLLAPVVGLWVIASVYRALRDRREVPRTLERLAKAVEGRVLPGRRPTIEGRLEGTAITLSFPVRFSAASDQRIELRLDAPGAPECRVRRRHARADLLEAGVAAERLDAPAARQRLEYVFGVLRAGELVVRGGSAQIGWTWPYTAEAMTPERLILPLAQVRLLVRMLSG